METHSVLQMYNIKYYEKQINKAFEKKLLEDKKRIIKELNITNKHDLELIDKVFQKLIEIQ